MKASLKEIIFSFCVTINILFLAIGYFSQDIYFILLGIMNLLLFFIGYAGWDKYQLNDEIQDGSWILYEINDLNKIFKQIDWSSTLVEINQEYKVWANAPTDFHLN